MNERRALDQDPQMAMKWVEACGRDLRILGRSLRAVPLKTLYMGGGTPSLLRPAQIEALVVALSEFYDFSALEEWTIECNPETLSLAYLKDLKSLGVTRISLGVQSFEPRVLRRLERLATSSMIRSSLEWVALTFDNFSLDLMLGTPDQGLNVALDDVKQALSFKPPHMATYLLTLEEGHVLKQSPVMAPKIASDDLATQIYLAVAEKLVSEGYHHYETSNFCQPGRESQHNANYWDTESSYLGLGPGAHGYVKTENGRVRYENLRDPFHFLKTSTFEFCETLTPDQQKLEQFYMTLRLKRPLQVTQTQRPIVQAWVNQDCMEWLTDGNARVTTRGWVLIEAIAQSLV
jgi:oxygen-independent coproporphyrinogen-3 oxidase